MDKDFWKSQWEARQIGFHAPEANAMLTAHISEFDLRKNARICLPLCGKTLDIHWLLGQGNRVIGIELVETAIQELFAELGEAPKVSHQGNLKLYQAENIDIFVGDIFEVTAEILGKVDCVYDRAALVALPQEMRKKYAQHLMQITENAPQLLITFNYDPTKMDGPPHYVSTDEISEHYGKVFTITELETKKMEALLKGQVIATEVATRLYV